MTAKPVIPRALAAQDVDDAITYYLSEQAEQAALGFIDALEQAYLHIRRHPATGSPRYAGISSPLDCASPATHETGAAKASAPRPVQGPPRRKGGVSSTSAGGVPFPNRAASLKRG